MYRISLFIKCFQITKEQKSKFRAVSLRNTMFKCSWSSLCVPPQSYSFPSFFPWEVSPCLNVIINAHAYFHAFCMWASLKRISFCILQQLVFFNLWALSMFMNYVLLLIHFHYYIVFHLKVYSVFICPFYLNLFVFFSNNTTMNILVQVSFFIYARDSLKGIFLYICVCV